MLWVQLTLEATLFFAESFFFKSLDINSGLKCIVQNSTTELEISLSNLSSTTRLHFPILPKLRKLKFHRITTLSFAFLEYFYGLKTSTGIHDKVLQVHSAFTGLWNVVHAKFPIQHFPAFQLDFWSLSSPNPVVW